MRYNYLDFARGILMSLGVIIHAAYIFSPDFEWRLSAENTNEIYTYIVGFIHSFRMQSFYIISGFFSMMIIEKYSLSKFLSSRFIRLGVPLIFCGFTINIVMTAFSWDNLHNLRETFNVNFWIGGDWLGHLWFLANLIGYSLVVYFIIKIVSVKRVKSILKIRIHYFLFVFIFILVTMFFKRISWHFPDFSYGRKWLIFDMGKFFSYFSFYLVGFVLYVNKDILENFYKSYILNFLLVIIYVLYKHFIIVYYNNEYLTEIIVYMYGLAFAGLLFAFFKKFFDQENDFIKSVSDASYTIYLVHQPLIVFWGIIVLSIDIPSFLQFIFIVIPTWTVSYLFHVKLVRKNSLLLLLFNGKINKTKQIIGSEETLTEMQLAKEKVLIN